MKAEPTILVLEVKTKLKQSSIGLNLVQSGPINHQYNTDRSKKLRIDLILKHCLHNNDLKQLIRKNIGAGDAGLHYYYCNNNPFRAKQVGVGSDHGG